MGDRGRWLAAAGFLAASLAVFFCCALVLARAPGPNSPSTRVAERYLERAASYDYRGIYRLFPPAVLEGEMERYGLDRAGIEALAEKNRALAGAYAQAVANRYAVTVSYRWHFVSEEVLGREELAALGESYGADGIDLDLREARRATFLVTAELAGQEHRAAGEEPLQLTVIRTPQGWFLDRGSVYAFETVMHTLPTLAWESFR